MDLESTKTKLNQLKEEVSTISKDISKNNIEQQRFTENIELLFKKLEVNPLPHPLAVESELWKRVGKP